MPERDLDVVVYGATGYCGRLVAEQLLARAPDGTRIALAGRSLARLGAVRDELGAGAADWPLLLADANHPATLTALARSTVAVASTAGPFTKYSAGLVEACAREGTHYADITGEIPFMRDVIDRADAAAQASGARIVLACGFDSIPSDLGVLFLHDATGPLGATTLVVSDFHSGYSGGTVATMRLLAAMAKSDPAVRELLADPYALSPDRDREPDRSDPEYSSAEGDLTGATQDPELGWLAPFVMAQINTRVVRWSNALAGFPYSTHFRYREAVGFGTGLSARTKALSAAAGARALNLATGFGPTRLGLGQVLPKPGEGPSAEARAAGRFTLDLHTQSLTGDRFLATVGADVEPGSTATALMLAEAVLFLASGSPKLPDRVGVLSPATGLGLPMIERLKANGMVFEVRRDDADPSAVEGRREEESTALNGDT